MRKRTYTSITFKPSPEMRKKIIELVNETEHPASTIVFRCMEYALGKVELRSVKKDIDFAE